MGNERRALPEGWEWIRLGDIAKINPKLEKKSISDDIEVTFLPMRSVEELTGKIDTSLSKKIFEVNNGYTPFKEDDLLFAKITPCMENGKIAIAQNLKNGLGFASTEFHIIRFPESVSNKFYFFYLMQTQIRQDAARNMTGTAGQQRVPADYLKNLKVPVPPLPTQRRIVSILEKAEETKRLRAQADELTNMLLQGVFLEMFGDPIKNSKGWEFVKFSKVGTLQRGKSKHRPRDAPELLGGKYPLIQTGDVANSHGYIREYHQTYSELGLKQSKMWLAGTLCITIAANIAKTGILTFDACFPDSVVGFTPDNNVKTEYVQFWLSFLQKKLEETAPESAQKNINLEILSNLNIPLPPLPLQQKFARIVDKVESIRQSQNQSKQQIEDLFSALMQKAFRGELET